MRYSILNLLNENGGVENGSSFTIRFGHIVIPLGNDFMHALDVFIETYLVFDIEQPKDLTDLCEFLQYTLHKDSSKLESHVKSFLRELKWIHYAWIDYHETFIYLCKIKNKIDKTMWELFK